MLCQRWVMGVLLFFFSVAVVWETNTVAQGKKVCSCYREQRDDRNQCSLRWPIDTTQEITFITFNIDASVPREWHTAIQLAAAAWNIALNDAGVHNLRFKLKPDENSPNIIKAINFGDDMKNVPAMSPLEIKPGSPFTGICYITKAEMRFNTGCQYDFTITKEPGKLDVQGIATHEFGHWLGLGDIEANFWIWRKCKDESVMVYRPYLPKDVNEWTLSLRNIKCGDIEALKKFYKPSVTATILVMDVSGSMSWRWRGGVKIDSAKKAALQFIEQVANEPRPPGAVHMIGVVTFSDGARLACPLTANYAEAKKTVIGLGTLNMTNLGAGLDEALKELTTIPSGKCFIILLSDGMTNTGKSRDQILATSVTEARKKGICIHTVGFGDPGDIDEDFLKKIAAQSGCGTYNYASSGFELFGTYIRVRHAMLGSNRIVDFSSGPSPVRMVPGQTATLGAFQLTAPAEELHFTLAWSEPGRMQAILVDPDNRKVTTNYPGVQIYSGNSFVHITVFSPKPGIWRASAAAVSSFISGVQYYGVVSARTGGWVIPYPIPMPCFNVLGNEVCVPVPDLPTVVIVIGSIAILAWVVYTRLVGP